MSIDVEALAEAIAAVALDLAPDDPSRPSWRETPGQLEQAGRIAAEYARLVPAEDEGDPRNLDDDERRVCGNCPHVKYDHFMPGSERCEIDGCPCPGFLTVPAAATPEPKP
jgi:hypothetical protein